MNQIDGINPVWAPKPVEPAGPIVPSSPMNPASGVSDVVEISTTAALAARIREIPDVRAELVARVKEEIAVGTYETAERIDAAVGKLLEDLAPELL